MWAQSDVISGSPVSAAQGVTPPGLQAELVKSASKNIAIMIIIIWSHLWTRGSSTGQPSGSRKVSPRYLTALRVFTSSRAKPVNIIWINLASNPCAKSFDQTWCHHKCQNHKHLWDKHRDSKALMFPVSIPSAVCCWWPVSARSYGPTRTGESLGEPDQSPGLRLGMQECETGGGFYFSNNNN